MALKPKATLRGVRAAVEAAHESACKEAVQAQSRRMAAGFDRQPKPTDTVSGRSPICEEVHPREIPLQMTILSQEIDTTRHLVEALETRLEPLCRDETPPPYGSDQDGPDTMFGRQIYSAGCQIQSLNNRLAHILSTLELP